jgi:putative ABC transport system permease protein
MVLGNGLTGISLGIDRMLNDFLAHKDSIEARLSLGASLWEAVRPWIQDAVRSGMVPIVNSMMVIGLVSLPGMMTGQILAGEDPVNAVAYQILIMFMIAACTALGTIGICLIGYWKLADPYERLNWEHILEIDE